MRGRSAAFDAAVSGSHQASCRVDVVQNGQVVAQLDVHTGSVTADRTAAQLRSFDVEVSDPTGVLTPEGMASLLAPFGTRLQLWRGVSVVNIVTPFLLNNTQASWTTTTPFGVNNGTVGAASDGALVMGP